MKLSVLLLLLALLAVSGACIAQEAINPRVVVYKPTPTSKPVIIPEQEWTAMQKMSKGESQEKLQELTNRMNQAGCPVVLTSAQMTPYLMLLKTSSNPSDASSDLGREPGIDLDFRNASGKEIRSIELDAEFLAKKSIYDLQAEKINLRLTAQGTQDIGKMLDHLRHLPLPERTHPVALNGISLQQVMFTDGSVWTSKSNDYCALSPNQMLPVGH